MTHPPGTMWKVTDDEPGRRVYQGHIPRLEPVPAMAHHLGMPGTVADLDNLALDQMWLNGLDALILSVRLSDDGDFVVESQTDDDAQINVTARGGDCPPFTERRPLGTVWELWEAGLTIDRIEPVGLAIATYGSARRLIRRRGQTDTYQASLIDTRRCARALLNPAVFGELFHARLAGNGDVRRVLKYGKLTGAGAVPTVALSTHDYLAGQEIEHDDDGWAPLWWHVSKSSLISTVGGCSGMDTVLGTAGPLVGAGKRRRIGRIRNKASGALGVELSGCKRIEAKGSTWMLPRFVDEMGDPSHGDGIEWRDDTGNEAVRRVHEMREWLAAGLTKREAYMLMASRDGWTQREIADRLGRKIGTVGTTISRAKKKLEKL